MAFLASRPDNDRAGAKLVPRETNAPFPSKTASDVISYSDHVALVTAISETEAPASTPQTNTPTGEQAIMRKVTFRVDTTLWSRQDAPPAPGQFTALWWGWLIQDGKRTPFIVNGAPVVFIGSQYVMPIAYDGTAFTVLQPFATFRFGGRSVTLEEQDTPLALDLAGASRNKIGKVFADATPDPLAVQFQHLLPRARLAAVIAAQRSSPTGP